MNKTLLKTATLGTNRFPYEKDSSFDGMPQKENPEEQLLSDAAFHLFAHKAGMANEPTKVDFIDPCPKETKPYLSEQAMYFFRNADSDYFLRLFIKLTNKNNKCLPPNDLPSLLDLAVQKKWSFSRIESIAGERGKWLIDFNKKWQEEFGLLTQKDWETGESKKRIRFLKQLRLNDPQKARLLFQETADQESVTDLAKFISCFHIGLSKEDEPVLSPFINHKRKAVRLESLQLLYAIPNAQIIERCKEYCSPFLQVEKKKMGTVLLKTTLPQDISKGMAADGITDEINVRGLGKKANILMQLIGTIPPNHWEIEFDSSPQELCIAAEKNTYADALFLGWSLATARHKNSEWSSALVQSLTKTNRLFEKIPVHIFSILVNLTPAEKIEELISNKLDSTTYLHPNNIGFALMKIYDKELNSSLTLKFFTLLFKGVSLQKKVQDRVFKGSVLNQLKSMIHLFPTKTLATLKTQWLYAENIAPVNLNPVLEALSNLEFKQKMQEAIENRD